MTQKPIMQVQEKPVRTKLNECVKEEIIDQAYLKGNFFETITRYRTDYLFLHYLNKIDKDLHRYAEACTLILSDKTHTKPILNILKGIKYYSELIPTEYSDFFYSDLKTILQAHYTQRHSFAKLSAHLVKLAVKHNLIKLRIRDRILPRNKQFIGAIICGHIVKVMNTIPYAQNVVLPQKLNIKESMDNLAIFIGEDYIVYPKVSEKEPLCVADDFIRVSTLSKFKNFKNMDRKAAYEALLAQLPPEPIEEHDADSDK